MPSLPSCVHVTTSRKPCSAAQASSLRFSAVARPRRRRLAAEDAHLLHLAIDLLESETARERDRAPVVAVDVGDCLSDVEAQRMDAELPQKRGSDSAAPHPG